MKPVYKRILLKLSGEVLAGEKGSGIDFDKVLEVCASVKECVEMGIEVAIVVGGGKLLARPLKRQNGPYESRPYGYACHHHKFSGAGRRA